jgi:hypothetical protein
VGDFGVASETRGPTNNDKEAVEMLNKERVKELIPPDFYPFAEYITEIAKLYVERGGDETMVETIILGDAVANSVECTAAAFRDAFIRQCEEWWLSPQLRQEIEGIAVPAQGPALVDYGAQHADDIARLRRLRPLAITKRTLAKIRYGGLLARKAVEMENWFHWVSSGAKEPNSHGEWGMDYGPKVSWTRTRTQMRVEQHAEKRNDFASWLVANGNEPHSESFMNCWEAVLFSAFRAKLVDKHWLQTIHGKAAFAYQFQHLRGNRKLTEAGVHYSEALSQGFGYRDSAPFEPRAGLIPRQGDILFWDRNTHVGISLGRSWVNGKASDRAMSLWLHNNGRFARLTLNDPNLERMRGTLRFVPCPFDPTLLGLAAPI